MPRLQPWHAHNVLPEHQTEHMHDTMAGLAHVQAHKLARSAPTSEQKRTMWSFNPRPRWRYVNDTHVSTAIDFCLWTTKRMLTDLQTAGAASAGTTSAPAALGDASRAGTGADATGAA